ncbi:MAG: dihydrodipicolinate synthase family protein [Pirellulales bacterium]|nr:dihydrodipicolinate synthase family protein [Pirellulales bacterium]
MSGKPLRISGLVAAAFTPMRENGSLALERVPGIVDFLHRNRIAGLYVVGSTGEGASLDSEERRATAEAFVRAAAGRMPVIVQTGHNSLADARRLAAHARQIGASAVSAVPPSYFKLDSIETLVACMAEVAAAAPGTPFYYYHIPRLTDAAFDMVDFLRHAGERIPTLAGMKYTAATLSEMQECIELDEGRFEVLSGLDEMLLPSLAVGARGAVGSIYNFAAPVFQKAICAFHDGDIRQARLWQSRAIKIINVVLRRGGLAGMKAAMALVGQDCGPTRLPVPPLTENERELLRGELTALGFFEWL